MSGDRSLDEFFRGGDGDDEGDASEPAGAAGPDEPADRSAAPDDGPEGSAAVEGATETRDDDTEPEAERKEGEQHDDAGSADTRSADGRSVAADGVDPATPTMRRTPGGAPCDGCGEPVERRWHDDGAFVCADCKEW